MKRLLFKKEKVRDESKKSLPNWEATIYLFARQNLFKFLLV